MPVGAAGKDAAMSEYWFGLCCIFHNGSLRRQIHAEQANWEGGDEWHGDYV
jgi:hypothetical protein